MPLASIVAVLYKSTATHTAMPLLLITADITRNGKSALKASPRLFLD
jgi:hypothetical protein